jgi:hypothetical protein
MVFHGFGFGFGSSGQLFQMTHVRQPPSTGWSEREFRRRSILVLARIIASYATRWADADQRGVSPTVNYGQPSSQTVPVACVNERLDLTGVVCRARVLVSGWLNLPPVVVGLGAAGGAGFLDRLFDCFTGFARALLNPAQQFFLLAFGVLEIVIREVIPFLFQLALGDVQVAFDFECRHK